MYQRSAAEVISILVLLCMLASERWTVVTLSFFSRPEDSAGRRVGVRAMQRVRRVCMGVRAAGCLRGRIVVGLQGGNASLEVLGIG